MKNLKWTIEFNVHESWVKDGFNIDRQKAIIMLESLLPYAKTSEIDARVISAPDPQLIIKLQS